MLTPTASATWAVVRYGGGFTGPECTSGLTDWDCRRARWGTSVMHVDDELRKSLQRGNKPMPKYDASVPVPRAHVARFFLADGAVLEVHVPDVMWVETASSSTRAPGFILRRGRKIANVGALWSMFHE